MALDLDSVRSGRQAAQATATALQRQITITVTSRDRIPLRDDLIYATNTANDLDDLEVRLGAGQSAMPLLTAAQITELQTLSQSLDQQIVARQLVNFSLDVAEDILNSAVRVRDIVRGNMPAAATAAAAANPGP